MTTMTSTLRGIVNAHGLCANSDDPDQWYPEKTPTDQEAAALCAGCPVRLTCLRLALRNEDKAASYGVWGGTTERTRRRLVRQIRARREARAVELVGEAVA